jgi:hypothetical protein
MAKDDRFSMNAAPRKEITPFGTGQFSAFTAVSVHN